VLPSYCRLPHERISTPLAPYWNDCLLRSLHLRCSRRSTLTTPVRHSQKFESPYVNIPTSIFVVGGRDLLSQPEWVYSIPIPPSSVDTMIVVFAVVPDTTAGPQ